MQELKSTEDLKAFLDAHSAENSDYVPITKFPVLFNALAESGLSLTEIAKIGIGLGESDKLFYIDYNDLSAVYNAFAWAKSFEEDVFWRAVFGLTCSPEEEAACKKLWDIAKLGTTWWVIQSLAEKAESSVQMTLTGLDYPEVFVSEIGAAMVRELGLQAGQALRANKVSGATLVFRTETGKVVLILRLNPAC